MNITMGSGLQAWVSALTAALVTFAAPVSNAQQAPAAVNTPTPSKVAANAATPTQATDKPDSSAFRSVFDGYRPYSEEKTIDWKQANELTARVGGWRAYAKEANSAESAPLTPAAATAPATKP